MRLSERQKAFCREYLKTDNAYQSALKAGYAKAYAKNATKQLLESRGIQNYIHRRTGKIVKKQDAEVDEVLTNIYKIASGQPITRSFVEIDNVKKEITLHGILTEPPAEKRDNYEKNYTTTSSAATKEQVAAAELWFKLRGMLKNDSKAIENEKIRKLKAEADIAEHEAKTVNELDQTNTEISFTPPPKPKQQEDDTDEDKNN